MLDNVLYHPERGDIHFSLYVPESYDGSTAVPLYIALPGWEGLYFQGVGTDLRWETLPFAARDYNPDMIIVSAQLNDWGMTSAQDTIALTEYLISAYNVNPNQVYLSGLSGGGETGSLVMGLRPDLYAAYLMVASQWEWISVFHSWDSASQTIHGATSSLIGKRICRSTTRTL